ncbi:MAG: hypothetical protein KGS09_00550 [Nitrospirae bacterium]|nr:hypothetical protein [Nitrospirota bacterium]MBU6479018.1 hypothetical protein [Nitrospirota bacterium]MDE3041981.1 hypothetical protein [Nitrospirota bacterium]MDE3220125.1 hypothetical protein [Nitrospirota bacterium]
MTTLWRTILSLAVTASLTGCVGTRIEYFTDTTYPPRSATSAVDWLPDEPARPHVEVARITVRSSNYSLETLRHTMLDRARSLGADAIVPEVPMVVMSRTGSPYYEPGLLGPAGAAFGLYGYGWYTPYSSNPYILTQGATDQPRIEHALSGIAIRFEDTPTDVR